MLAKKASFNIGTPTGNFENILAGYFATKMGLPIDKLVGILVDTYSLLVAINEYVKKLFLYHSQCLASFQTRLSIL